jgi:uncharacterized protein DUF397
MNKNIIGASDWRKSSRSSDPDLAQCVEVAAIDLTTNLTTDARNA